MIGLIFLSVFIIWILFSIYIGIKIPIWCKSKRPKTMALLCIPLVFFAPVADEIIAYPQMMALCEQGGYELVINEKEAYGKTVYYSFEPSYSKRIDYIFPSTIQIYTHPVSFNDINNKSPIIIRNRFFTKKASWLNFPSGSSSDTILFILPQGCKNNWLSDNNGIPKKFEFLKLNFIKE